MHYEKFKFDGQLQFSTHQQMGKMRHFKLGQFFRRRYGKLLADGYSPKKVYVESTDVDRTIAVR